MASVPASGPGPNTATKSSAQTSELIEREVTKMNFANRLSGGFGVTLRAASRPTGSARTIAMIVPSVAMCSVSTMPFERRADIGRIRRPHPREQVDHLVRRVVEKLRDHIDRSQRGDQSRDGDAR